MVKTRLTTKERLQEVLMVLGISASEFEKRCGLAHGFVARVTREITKKTRQRIKEAFPDLNINYIAFGSGEMFIKEGTAADTIKDRINQFIEHMECNKRDFIHRTGISETFISNMSDNVRASSVEKICRAYPLLNPEWLIYGEGEMILEKAGRKPTDTIYDRIERLIEFLGTTTTTFKAEVGLKSIGKNITKKSADRIVRRYPFVNPTWLMQGIGTMTGQPKCDGSVFLVPVISQRTARETAEKIPHTESGNIIAIEVSGNSMDDNTADAYRNGDIVIAREVLPSETIPFEKYDFVIFHSSGILIRRILRYGKKHVVVHALNTAYEDIELDTDDVEKVFIVTSRISKPRH